MKFAATEVSCHEENVTASGTNNVALEKPLAKMLDFAGLSSLHIAVPCHGGITGAEHTVSLADWYRVHSHAQTACLVLLAEILFHPNASL